MKKKNIQIFYGGFTFNKGGVNSHAHLLSAELKKSFNVCLISLDRLPFILRYIPYIIAKLINLISPPLGFFYKGVITRYFYKFLFDEQVNYRIFEDIYLSWNSEIPSVTVLHAVWSDNLQGHTIKQKEIELLKKKEVLTINKINHSLCTVSKPYSIYLKTKHFNNRIKKIAPLEIGINKKLIVHRPHIAPKSLIYVGSLEARKNIFFLIEVFNKLYKFDTDYKLTIVGDGPHYKPLISLCNQLRLPVNFIGKKNNNETFNELSKNNIYIHTSIKESFSLSLLEAKMCGLVTVAYKKLQVPKEFIDIGLNNFDPDKWFSKIIKIKKKYKKINEKKYSIDNYAKKLINIAR
jgi:glycosyltransferase involved in cell wall biosynthesis